ncbi:MAG TPA: glycosyltransferase [Pseudonocardiaceae bacterium]|jgi:hypothetical protein|nr:glycosyltransferase [Pseudonocardiaceae bacterium]
MSAPRVLCCHPSAERYGSDRVFLESVAALAGAGWQVTVTVPADGELLDALRAAGARVLLCPTAVLRKAALRPAGLLRLLLDVVRGLGPMLRVLRECRPDLVYVNTVIVPGWLLLAKLLRHKTVAHVHEAEDGVPGPIRTALALPLLAADTILVNSRASARTITSGLPRLRSRIRLLYNGVAGPPRQLPPRGQPHDPVRLVLVGRLSPRKGTDIAVEALGRLTARQAVTLDVYGSVFAGYEWYETQLRQRIDELGLAESVRLHGFRSEVWDAYAEADIALVPSRVEPFGNTSVEAQLAGAPVIVTDVQGLPETVAGGRFGTIVPAADPVALADAIDALLADWPAALATAAAARANAVEEFAPETYRAKVVATLGELLGRTATTS